MTLDILVLTRSKEDRAAYPLEQRPLQLWLDIGEARVPTRVYGESVTELYERFAEALGGLVRGAKP